MKFIQTFVSLSALALVLAHSISLQATASTPNPLNMKGDSIMMKTGRCIMRI